MDPKFVKAEELGIRLEILGNLPIWEASPTYGHQRAVDRIRASIKTTVNTTTECACIHVADVYVQFPDGSIKRPDISIFGREPTELYEAVTLIPEAVIEVVSKGYEAKDLELGPPFYLGQGVKDLIVFDPATDDVLHYTPSGKSTHKSPVAINFSCGCACVV
jgi:Uma2 family endonuclease